MTKTNFAHSNNSSRVLKLRCEALDTVRIVLDVLEEITNKVSTIDAD